jgi:hypothetical protein
MEQISLQNCQLLKPSLFWHPHCLPQSAWVEHVPFAFWLSETHRPNSIVELGSHYGLSYFAFCQAVQNLQLPTKCYAIDTWQGDPHAGYYGDDVFEYVKNNNINYQEFSVLIRSTFNNALERFEDNSIDLLHIDGLHTFEAVSGDFHNWLPKLSDKAIVLFHDTNVKENGFGVYKLWDQLSLQYPSFEFLHGYGLGVLAVGKNLNDEMNAFFIESQNSNAKSLIRDLFSRLGYTINLKQGLDATLGQLSIEQENNKKLELQLKEKTEALHNIKEGPGTAFNNPHFTNEENINQNERIKSIENELALLKESVQNQHNQLLFSIREFTEQNEVLQAELVRKSMEMKSVESDKDEIISRFLFTINYLKQHSSKQYGK